MLLLHQVGSVKIGEVVRYTVTYIPSQDRILPSPERLHLRIRNTSAIALRAAFVHGPYTLSVAAYPSTFDPNKRFTEPRRYGVPEFEPMLKAGGSWECELVVPDTIRQAAGTGSHGGFGKSHDHDDESVTWVIEVSSQVIFSTSVAVGFEVVVARERKSLSLSQNLPMKTGQSHVSRPGNISDHQQSVGAKDGHHPAQAQGVFSRAVKLKVEDTATLWNTPRLPGWDDKGTERVHQQEGADEPVESMVNTGDPETKEEQEPIRKQKKVHLVVLTHGLHSNLGADMLYMKESIDSAARQAKVDSRARRAKERASRRSSTQPTSGSDKGEPRDGDAPANKKHGDSNDDEDDDDEEVIVRGYSGNATKTERGIKYLGKRLARYVLSMTYPDQPYIPLGKGTGEGLVHGIGGDLHEMETKASHKHSTIHHDKHPPATRPYKITSISFVAHSLGGLVQTYAVAYIQKHSPQFFDLIKPIHFIGLATPFLGLSNENPVYIRFALDFGLVGRTGKDLGLTWRAPTIARNGWGAIVGNLGETAQKKVYGETQPESKPLLRILPTGPAHTALKKFRNRTLYSNVVNDGIVPLRTSCLLFLDWQGLGRVEKARRDAGLVETMVGFGWAELTGTNSPRQKPASTRDSKITDRGTSSPNDEEERFQVPQPSSNAVAEDDRASLGSVASPYSDAERPDPGEQPSNGPLSGFFNLFKSNDPPKPQVFSRKQKKIFKRGQTLNLEGNSTTTDSSTSDVSRNNLVTTGQEMEEHPEAPPRTTVFESAHDLMNPKLPNTEFLIDPSKRQRTIFHDRVYHPSDIPAPPLKKRATTLSIRKTLNRVGSSSQQSTESGSSSATATPSLEEPQRGDTPGPNSSKHEFDVVDSSDMRVEEKIARGYHRDLAWRKVLVKLEPDAHNNICVRRMFANAYGWPVIKHMVDAHFSDSAVARMSTADEYLGERALDIGQPPDEHGGETKSVPLSCEAPRSDDDTVSASRKPSVPVDDGDGDEVQEARDQVPDLPKMRDSDVSSTAATTPRPGIERMDSVTWSERDWADSDNESDDMSPGIKQGAKGAEDDEAGEGKGWNWTEKIVGRGGTTSSKGKQVDGHH